MRIGILGGTFDPPHDAHLMIAQEVLSACSLDEVWLMPSAVPPHKTEETITPARERIEMVKRAVADNEHLKVSLIEFKREGLSYTYDTMAELIRRYPGDQFFFIIGADMIEDLPHWHRVSELVQMVNFVGVRRPGYTTHSQYVNAMDQVDVPAFDISASFLRERFMEGRNTRYFLPDAVRYYIEEKKLYGQNNRVKDR